ncbi:MAG TPA: DUF3108 domain-containing protein [Bacillota bacterium]
MKRIDLIIRLTLVCSVLLCSLVTGHGLAQDQTTLNEPAQDNMELSATVRHHPFWEAGERLVYRVEVKGIPVGSQVLTVVGETIFKGHPVYQIKMELSTYAALRLLYKFHEEEELFLDQASLHPRYVKREVQEKKRLTTEEIRFLIEEKRVEMVQDRDGEVRNKTFPLDQPCLENLSIVYYLRSRPWLRGEESILFFTSGGPQVYNISFVGTEEVSTPYRKVEADRIEDENARITVWISKDEAAIPVAIRATTDFGVIISRLVEVE